MDSRVGFDCYKKPGIILFGAFSGSGILTFLSYSNGFTVIRFWNILGDAKEPKTHQYQNKLSKNDGSNLQDLE